MATLSPGNLGIIIALGFFPFLLIRPLLAKRFVESVHQVRQPRRAFYLDFSICICASILINLHNLIVLDFPPGNLTSLLIGCIIAGFFIGLDTSLSQEKSVILRAMAQDKDVVLAEKFYPMTRKFTLVAGTTFVFVALIFIMVFSRDVEWLIQTAQDPEAIASAQLSVTYEIFFIMGVLMILIVNLIFSYSKNLKLLFNNQTRILERVSKGDLSSKVPVATQDEFGIIAGHTNHMIEGLRHRFELISALKLAEEVQQNLLPSRSPYLKGFDISGFSLYCDQTGGDYYDYFLLPDNKLGIVVADVCGHGIGAAMLMATVRTFLISALESYTDPAYLLNHINKLISRDCAGSGSFTTMFFLEIDPETNTLQWIRAGHDPALFFHQQTGQFTTLDGRGLVLGVDEAFVYENQKTCDIKTGDIILIGTDGIHETRNRQNDTFGQQRVQDIIRHHADKTARHIEKNIVSEVSKFRGELEQEDDVTLVVIKVE